MTGSSRRAEILLFLFLVLVLAPLVAVGVVSAYGFAVWMTHLVYGPPGPPA